MRSSWKAAWALIASFVVVASGLLARGCVAEPAEGPLPAQLTEGESAAEASSLTDSEAGMDRETGATRAEHAREVLGHGDLVVRGHVVDAQFGAPLAATVFPSRSPGTCTDEESGSFTVKIPRGEVASLRAVSNGYQERVVSLGPDSGKSSLRIALEPTRSARVHARYEGGRAAVGLPVLWQAANGSTRRSGDWKEPSALLTGVEKVAVTNSEGISEVPLGTPGLATLVDLESGFRKTTRVLPGEERSIIIPECAQVIQFVHGADGSPYPNLEVQTRAPREVGDVVQDLTTDAEGRVRVFGMVFPVLLRLGGNQCWQYRLSVLSGSARLSGSEPTPDHLVTLDSVACDAPVVLAVNDCAGRLLLVDSQTNEPVEGLATLSYRRAPKDEDDRGLGPVDRRSPACWAQVGYGETPYSVRAGIVHLPCMMRRSPDQLADLSRIQANLLVLVSGYAPLRIPNVSEIGLEADPLPKLLVDPVPSRRLAVRFEDGFPMTEALIVRAAEERIRLFESRGSSAGIHGPFDWFGGPVEVRVGSWKQTIPASRLAVEETVELTVPGRTGALEITGIPPEAAGIPMVAKSAAGELELEFRPSAWSSGLCRFTGLAPGGYVAGPRDWVRVSEVQGLLMSVTGEVDRIGPRVHVRPGETTRIAWRSSWGQSSELTGTVRILAREQARPWIVPIHGLAAPSPHESPQAPRVNFSRLSPRLPVDEDGRYRIPAMSPIPDLLLICLPDAGSSQPWESSKALRVLDTIKPGESIAIETGSLELRWAGAATDRVAHVEIQIPPESMRHPVHSRRSRWYWRTEEALVLDAVPTSVGRLIVNGRVLEVEPSPGAHQVLDVILEDLPQSSP